MPDATIPVVCPTCQAKMKAPASLVGRTGKCPKCKTSVPIKQEEEPVLALDEHPAPAPHHPATSSPQSVPGNKVAGAAAILLAVVSFVVAGVAYDQADTADRSEARTADAVNKLSVTLAGATGNYRDLKMREGKKADRSVVYVAAVSGVIFIAAGLVCFTLSGRSGPTPAPPNPAVPAISDGWKQEAAPEPALEPASVIFPALGSIAIIVIFLLICRAGK